MPPLNAYPARRLFKLSFCGYSDISTSIPIVSRRGVFFQAVLALIDRAKSKESVA